jgi:ParB-like chromosome segregation protein Spo0J
MSKITIKPTYTLQDIPLELLFANTGQIEGLPRNPRTISDSGKEKLKNSIQDDPEMLHLRELIVFPFNDIFIVIAGNQRRDVLAELGYKTAPCKILDKSTPLDKLKAYVIKDNVDHGDHDWDALELEWDQTDLKDWGLEPEPEKLSEDLTESKEVYHLSIRMSTEKKAKTLMEDLEGKGHKVKLIKRKSVIKSEKTAKNGSSTPNK